MPRTSKESVLVLKTIRDVVGDDGMRSLYEARNGTEIWIPLRYDADHWMTKLFGSEKANQICSRLTVTNADGKDFCNLSAYVFNGQNRIQTFLRQIKSEITEHLLSGKGVQETAIAVGVSVRTVNTEFKSLVDTKKLTRQRRVNHLPPRLLTPALPKLPVEPGHWEIKSALVGEALLGAVPTGSISVAMGVSRGYVRIRRKMLEAAGKLKAVPRRDALQPDRKLRDLVHSPDLSANIGEMVRAPPDEV